MRRAAHLALVGSGEVALRRRWKGCHLHLVGVLEGRTIELALRDELAVEPGLRAAVIEERDERRHTRLFTWESSHVRSGAKGTRDTRFEAAQLYSAHRPCCGCNRRAKGG